MGKLFKNSWALFLGYGILIVAHGLQGNLLGVRAVIEDFNTTDYIEAYVGLQNNDVNANLLANAAYNEFGAFRLGT